MKALLQRVQRANVVVGEKLIAEIGSGLLVFLGFDHQDGNAEADRLLDRLLKYRMFADETGRMNLNVGEIGGGVLLVSQFTLSANTMKGLRPSFSQAMPPAEARALYNYMLDQLRASHSPVAAGQFGADMQVELINDGPVTFLLESA
ncbi:MAG: D-aminoacyl-tRNA deacylase [Pseudomonadota bacterium]